ncbi:LysR family transcriptional regulator [Mycetocola lacteus]|uniref:LysR family transcriptional regulator n=1 Tax=Mycetocola lacteus TaxID=76637 RepID=A0A3L7AKG5_9MICO|nr:LysR family transcriptional regulator [Mycetocola lacteus]RLP80200.1 LysR family transcriptional regulator [Mycetocola lacteus]
MTEKFSVESLRYAQAVSETASFSAAARAYGVSQPALSNGIAKLEERLGERLFDRSPRGVQATAFGVQMLPLIDRALKALDEIPAEAALWKGPATGDIRIGVSPLINPALIARAYSAVCCLDMLPGPRQLVLREANVAELRTALLADELDLILIPSVAPMPRHKHRIIDSEPLVVVESWPRSLNQIELAELTSKPLILMPNTCGLTTFTRDLFSAHDLALREYPGEAATYRVLEEWAKLGLGAAIIPRSKLATPDAAHRPLYDDGIEVEIFYEAVWSPESSLATDIEALTGMLSNGAASPEVITKGY